MPDTSMSRDASKREEDKRIDALLCTSDDDALETHGTIICATWAKDALPPASPTEVSINDCNCN